MTDHLELATGIGVESRDFGQPRRLGPARRTSLERVVRAELSELGQDLRRWMRETPRFELDSLDEGHAGDIQDRLASDAVGLRFRCAGEIGWLIWERAAAVRVAEICLGSPEPEDVMDQLTRDITPLESAILADLLAHIVERVSLKIGLTIREPHFAFARDGFGSWMDRDGLGDPGRLVLDLCFKGPGGRSRMRLAVPDRSSPSNNMAAKTEVEITPVVQSVPLCVSVRLGSSDLLLRDLLSLEPGQVLPLDVRPGEPLRIFVEDRELGTATQLDTEGGPVQIRIDSFSTEPKS